MRKARKSLLLAVVVIAHALLIVFLIDESQTFRLAGVASVVPISAMLVPMHRRRRLFPPARLRSLAVPVPPITAPITVIFSAISRPVQVPRRRDWALSASQAVHAVLKRGRHVAMGFPKAARSRSSLHSPPSGVRSQGPEVYRTRTGETVYRSGGDCYVESGPAPIDASQLEQQMQMSSVTCSRAAPSGPPPDNLFKSLPAYRKYHAVDRYPIRRRHHHHHRHHAGGDEDK